jgi:hypothetical protein
VRHNGELHRDRCVDTDAFETAPMLVLVGESLVRRCLRPVLAARMRCGRGTVCRART